MQLLSTFALVSRIVFSIVVATVIAAPPAVHAVTIETIPIGNPDNLPDMRYPNLGLPAGRGSVGYAFRMGKTEVTNAQYVDFLNAVGADDRFQLYHPFMTSSTQGGIVGNGTFRRRADWLARVNHGAVG